MKTEVRQIIDAPPSPKHRVFSREVQAAKKAAAATKRPCADCGRAAYGLQTECRRCRAITKRAAHSLACAARRRRLTGAAFCTALDIDAIFSAVKSPPAQPTAAKHPCC